MIKTKSKNVLLFKNKVTGYCTYPIKSDCLLMVWRRTFLFS